MRGPLVREVGQSFYLMALMGGVIGTFLAIGLFVSNALA